MSASQFPIANRLKTNGAGPVYVIVWVWVWDPVGSVEHCWCSNYVLEVDFQEFGALEGLLCISVQYFLDWKHVQAIIGWYYLFIKVLCRLSISGRLIESLCMDARCERVWYVRVHTCTCRQVRICTSYPYMYVSMYFFSVSMDMSNSNIREYLISRSENRVIEWETGNKFSMVRRSQCHLQWPVIRIVDPDWRKSHPICISKVTMHIFRPTDLDRLRTETEN
jgi:hypothetical protein